MPEKKITRQRTNFVGRLGQNLQRILRETIGELHKVTWPTRQEAINLTRVVLIVILSMSVFLGLLDILFTRLFSLVFGT